MTWEMKAGLMGKGESRGSSRASRRLRRLESIQRVECSSTSPYLFTAPPRPATFTLTPTVQYEAASYLLAQFPGLEEKISVEEYLAERVEMQDALFRKVPPMRGAVALVQGLVSAR